MFTSITLSRFLSLLLIPFLIPTSPSSTDTHLSFSLALSLPPLPPFPFFLASFFLFNLVIFL